MVMNKKLTNIKPKQIEKKALKNFEQFNQSPYVQNPLEAKFLAFQKTKKEIEIKDLF